MTTQYFKVRNGLTVGEDAVTVDGTTGATTIAGEYTLPVVDGTADQIIKTDGAGNLSWYTPTDTNTTYTIDASSTTGGANLNLVGSDASTDTVKIASGTGVTVAQVSANELSVAIGQPVGTTDDVIFNTVDANLTDDNYVLGQLIATRNTAYTPPPNVLTTIAGQNGFVISSSSGGAGYGANIAIRYHSGDTTAGVGNAASLNFSGASGTNSAPGGVATNQVLGSNAYDGYTAGTSNNYALNIATANQGAGTTSLVPLQAQGYARQAFTNSTTVTTAVTGASGTGTTATLTFTTQNTAPYAVGQTVTVAGMTPSGYNGTVVITAATTSSISYANATTGFTSGGTIAAANTVTAAGCGFRVRGFANSTNMTVANRFNFMDLTASAATFKSNTYTFANEVITGSTLTATNYLTLGSTGITAGNVDGVVNFVRASGANTGTRPVAFLKNTVTATTTPATNDGASFRFQAQGSNGTAYHLAQFSGVYSSTGDTAFTADIANGDQTGATMTTVQPFITKLSGTTIKATATPTATAGGNTLNDIAIFGATTTLLKNATTAATYASISSTGQTFTSTGRMNIIRTTPGTGILLRQQTANTDPVNNDEMDFRLSIAGTVTSSDFARFDGTYKSSGDNEIGMSVSTDSFATDTDKIYVGSRASTKIRATPSGGGTASDILTVTDTTVTSARPFVFPTYTAAAAGAITGAVGWQISISDSPTVGGRMAFWDTTNARWSYISDNSAV